MGANNKERAVNQALRHPIRCEILRWVSESGHSSPRSISDGLGCQLPNVSYHVRVLRDAGLLDETDRIPIRGSLKHIYRLNPDAVKTPVVSQVLRSTIQRISPDQ
ncbi:MAG: ArsR/SmtB family transcription factor [Solirubrobacterales bacterium]